MTRERERCRVSPKPRDVAAVCRVASLVVSQEFTFVCPERSLCTCQMSAAAPRFTLTGSKLLRRRHRLCPPASASCGPRSHGLARSFAGQRRGKGSERREEMLLKVKAAQNNSERERVTAGGWKWKEPVSWGGSGQGCPVTVCKSPLSSRMEIIYRIIEEFGTGGMQMY